MNEATEEKKQAMRSATTVLIVAIFGLLLMQPALAEEMDYGLYGDISTFTPTDMDTYYPGKLRGVVKIDDPGNGSPILKSINIWSQYPVDLNGDTTCCAGTEVEVFVDNVTTVSGVPVTGTGSTTTSIDFGPVSGYAQTGTIFCETTPGPGCPGCSSCTQAGLAEGSFGPTVPLTSTVFNIDPLVFTSDGSSYTATPVQVTNLNPAINVTAHTRQKGFFTLIPTLPLLGLGVLGALFLGVGAKVVRGRS